MTVHLSVLQIDEIAAGLRTADAHLDSCLTCRERLDAVRAHSAQLQNSPRFQRTRRALASAPPESTKHQTKRWWFSPAFAGLALALGIVIFVSTYDTPVLTNRLKGAAHLRLVDEKGQATNQPLQPGQHVTLQIGSVAHGFGLVFVADQFGHVERLWPTQNAESGPLRIGAVQPVGEGFEVTPGQFTLHAILSERPLNAAAIQNAVERIEVARQAGQTTESLELPVDSIHLMTDVSVAP